MNWPEIKGEYPLSWNVLIQFKAEDVMLPVHLCVTYEFPMEIKTIHNIHTRDLFDFFDYHDVFIEIEPEKVDRWNFYIHKCLDNDNLDPIKTNENRYYLTRKEAEEEAFIQSFVLLEKKLKKNDK